MRDTFSDLVEKGRTKGPPFGTRRGQPFGAFFLTHPVTREVLKILATDGGGAAELGLARWEHVSVSCERRCPHWDEMHWVKQQFFKPEECVFQFHPPEADYVNTNPNVLHMWRPCETTIPLPPKECV
jgi:hypothetical protein